MFVTAILTILPTTQFSGLLQPVSTLEGGAQDRWIVVADDVLHARQRRHHCTKGLGFDILRGRRDRPGLVHSGATDCQPPRHCGNRNCDDEAHPPTSSGLGPEGITQPSRDPVLVLFMLYAFTLGDLHPGRGVKAEVNNASLAFIDEDQSSCRSSSSRIPPAAIPALQIIAPGDATRQWIAADICSSSRSRPASNPTFAGPAHRGAGER